MECCLSAIPSSMLRPFRILTRTARQKRAGRQRRSGPWFLVLAIMVTIPGIAVLSPPCAKSYAFHHQDARDWVRAHYNARMYGNDFWNDKCTCMVSLAYRKGAGVPFRRVGYYAADAFWVDPDSWGASVPGPNFYSPSWVNVKAFRDFFNSYPPQGNVWRRVTNHRCSAAPTEDDRWSGGYVVFYHHSVDNRPDGACAFDYYHTGMIYGRHVRSWYGSMPYGTCKVERTSDEVYRDSNLINLKDRFPNVGGQPHPTRKKNFVQVNTLVYDP